MQVAHFSGRLIKSLYFKIFFLENNDVEFQKTYKQLKGWCYFMSFQNSFQIQILSTFPSRISYL